VTRFATPLLAETRSPPLRATGCALALLLSDCLGGQTGGEHDGMGGRGVTAGSDQQCQARIEALPFEAPSVIGLSGADALAAFGGAHTASLSWNETTEPLTYGPEQGASTIELTLVSASSPVRSVRYERQTPIGPAGTGASTAADAAEPSGCAPDHLELDVAIQLTTGGGALSEAFDATLQVYSATNAQLSKQLDLLSLTGTFAVSVPEGYSTRELRVQASFADAVFSGQLSGELQGPEGSGLEERKASIQIIQYAQWPANSGEPTGPRP
jgi:hypothetical protein